MALDADERDARRRARELSHYITKKEALALCVNLLERHMQHHHRNGGWFRRLWARWRGR